MNSSAADSAIDSFYTAQEGSSVNIEYQDGVIREESGQTEEVTSKFSTQPASKSQEQYAGSSQRGQPLSKDAAPKQIAARVAPRRPSRAPICMLSSKRTPLRRALPETQASRKRTCIGSLGSEPATPDICARQSQFTAPREEPVRALPAQLCLHQEAFTSPENPGTGSGRNGPCHTQGKDMSALHTVTPPAARRNTDSSLLHRGDSGNLSELNAGTASPTQTDEAGACQTRLGAKAGGPQLLESSAVSRRRLSFFAQLKRPVQVHGSSIRAADTDGAVLAQRQKAAQDHKEAQQQFKHAYVNAQLAQEWAAGQAWAELDAYGVPWSTEAVALAEGRWVQITASQDGSAAMVGARREAEKEWDYLRMIRMRHCSSQRDSAGMAVIKGILKAAATRSEGSATLKPKLCKVRIKEGS